MRPTVLPKKTPFNGLTTLNSGAFVCLVMEWFRHQNTETVRIYHPLHDKEVGYRIPLGAHVSSASPHEVTVIESTLENVAVPRVDRGRPRKNPTRQICDMAADSDAPRDRLARQGVEAICPYRRNHSKHRRYDGHTFRRYKRRWKIERSISWIGSFHRLLARHDHEVTMFLAFLLAAAGN
jgi:transposase